MMLVPVIGGIVLASVSELDFTWACLAAAGGANVAAAFRGQENKKAMAGDMKDALGGGANAYAIGTLWSTLLLIPTIFISGEYQKVCARTLGQRARFPAADYGVLLSRIAQPCCSHRHAAVDRSTSSSRSGRTMVCLARRATSASTCSCQGSPFTSTTRSRPSRSARWRA